MSKKVLILGGAGFIGLGIARFLGENRDHDITIADLFTPGQLDEDFNKVVLKFSITVVEGDFTKQESFKMLGKDYDYIYMLASVVGVNRCIEEPHEVIRINTALIQNVLQWATECKNAGKILFSSSSECYAAATDVFDFPVPTSETVPLTISEIGHPRFTYAVTKMLGESAFLNYGKQFNFPVTVVRYQNIFGPRMGFKHAIPHLIQRFYEGEGPLFSIYGPDQTRAFCYLSDAAEGTVLAMENESADQEIFHIGSTDEITIDNLTRTVGAEMGYKGDYVNASTYPGSVSRRCPDIAKAIDLLGYNPKVPWQDGLKESVLWYVNFFDSGQKIPSGGFQKPDKLKI